MPDSRRIAALRALAARPGTPAEGEVAQRKLEEALAKEPVKAPRVYRRSPLEDAIRDALFQQMGVRMAREAIGRFYSVRRAEAPFCEPTGMPWFLDRQCACGVDRAFDIKHCQNFEGHTQIEDMLSARFPLFTRIYYNGPSCVANRRGRVFMHSMQWNFLDILFDDSFTPIEVMAYSRKGWHVSIQPLDPNGQLCVRLRSKENL